MARKLNQAGDGPPRRGAPGVPGTPPASGNRVPKASAGAMVRSKAAPGRRTPGTTLTINEYTCMREVFWENIIRDMLMSLHALGEQEKSLFDGRVAVLTKGGERVPIASVAPLFAVTVIDSRADKEASRAVQCSVFRIITPAGDVFTLPLHEIRAVHSLTPELIERLQQQETADDDAEQGEQRPFGFAAFRSLPNLSEELPEAPIHPTE